MIFCHVYFFICWSFSCRECSEAFLTHACNFYVFHFVFLVQVLPVQRSARVRPPAVLRRMENARAAAAGAGEGGGLPGNFILFLQ